MVGEYDPVQGELNAMIHIEQATSRAMQWRARFNATSSMEKRIDLCAEAMRDPDFHYRWLVLLRTAPDFGSIE